MHHSCLLSSMTRGQYLASLPTLFTTSPTLYATKSSFMRIYEHMVDSHPPLLSSMISSLVPSPQLISMTIFGDANKGVNTEGTDTSMVWA
jgi:hypothetical protein